MQLDDLPLRRRTSQAPPTDHTGGRKRLLGMMAVPSRCFWR